MLRKRIVDGEKLEKFCSLLIALNIFLKNKMSHSVQLNILLTIFLNVSKFQHILCVLLCIVLYRSY
jgi:hypothetical protein